MTEVRSVYLERHDPSRNMARFYVLAIEIDLFGSIVAVRRWGRIGSRGRSCSTVCGSLGEAAEIVAVGARAKARRGYRERAGGPSRSSAHAGGESS